METADDRRDLIEFLIGLGATADDLELYRDELPGLASVLALRGGPTVTFEEAVARSGLSEDKVRRLTRAAGFADEQAGERVFSEGFVALASGIRAAEGLFGEEEVMQLVRVMGAATARVADAVVSAFLVNVEPGAREDGELGVARANAEATKLLPLVCSALEVLLRQHLIAARRGLADEGVAGYETQRLAVGFVDVVGSTALAHELAAGELGTLLTEFENVASDTVVAAGGRVVKLIGDEILFTAPDASAAAAAAREVVRRFAGHPRIAGLRGGVASGSVLLRGGDVFGPVVNLAARCAKVAGRNEVVVPAALASDAGLPAEPVEPTPLKGFAEPVALARLV